MQDVFIVSAIRTPVGKQRGYYRGYVAPELLALVLNEVVERVHLDAALVDDVITGCVYQIDEQGFNLARMGVLSSRTRLHGRRLGSGNHLRAGLVLMFDRLPCADGSRIKIPKNSGRDTH